MCGTALCLSANTGGTNTKIAPQRYNHDHKRRT